MAQPLRLRRATRRWLTRLDRKARDADLRVRCRSARYCASGCSRPAAVCRHAGPATTGGRSPRARSRTPPATACAMPPERRKGGPPRCGARTRPQSSGHNATLAGDECGSRAHHRATPQPERSVLPMRYARSTRRRGRLLGAPLSLPRSHHSPVPPCRVGGQPRTPQRTSAGRREAATRTGRTRRQRR